MSKLTINKSISNFLNKNKIKFAAISTATIMATTMSSLTALTSCTYNKPNNEGTIQQLTKHQQDLRTHITSYINNMDIFENAEVGGYYIYEELYEDAPGITRDKNDNLIETNKNFIGYNQFFVSFEEAELLELTELLESRIFNNTKTK